MRRVCYAASLCLALGTILVAAVAPAQADLQSEVAHDLLVSGVPGAQVSLSAPSGIETELRRADPTAPILRVTYTPLTAPLLSGLLPPEPGALPLYDRGTGSELVWELAIVAATKHALAAGASLGGLAITTRRADGTEETLTSALPEEPPEVQAPVTLSPDQVKSRVEAALPPQASSAAVTVTDDAVGERVVSVTLVRPASVFRVLDLPETAKQLIEQQIALAPLGGNIGRVILRVQDPVSGDPLYTAAHDVLFGYLSQWYAPLVRAWASPVVAVGEDTPSNLAASIPQDPSSADLPTGGATP